MSFHPIMIDGPSVNDLKYMYGCDIAAELRTHVNHARVHVAPGDFTNAGLVRITAFRPADASFFIMYADDFETGIEAIELAEAHINRKVGA